MTFNESKHGKINFPCYRSLLNSSMPLPLQPPVPLTNLYTLVAIFLLFIHFHITLWRPFVSFSFELVHTQQSGKYMTPSFPFYVHLCLLWAPLRTYFYPSAPTISNGIAVNILSISLWRKNCKIFQRGNNHGKMFHKTGLKVVAKDTNVW